MSELLDAVDAITKPTSTRITQPVYETILEGGRPVVDDEGNPRREVVGTKRVTLHHPPLLDQLEQAIYGTMNTVAGDSATLAFTRGMLDSEALYQFTRISSTIKGWAITVGAPRRDTVGEQLRAWYVAFMEGTPEESKVNWHTRTINGWVSLITDKLDPFDEYVQPDPCPNPECPQGFDPVTGKPTWFNPRTREQLTDPLLIQFRRADGPRLVEYARARCRACGRVWGVRALAWELEQARHAEAEGITPV